MSYASDTFGGSTMANWAMPKGTFTEGSGVATAPTTGTREWGNWNVSVPFATDDYYVEADITINTVPFIGIHGRSIDGWTDEIIGYVAHIDTNGGGRITLYDYGVGTPENWHLRETAASPPTLTSGNTYTVRLWMSGDNIQVWVGPAGGGLTKYIDYTDPTPITTPGFAGIKSGGAGATWDNFLVEAIAAGGGVPAGTLGLLGVGI